MFTGLVEARARVLSLARRGEGARLALERPAPVWEVARGESVAVSGCCLSAAGGEGSAGALAFDLSAETLARTTLLELGPGAWVNLERSLRLGERLGGHLVQGHVDGVGRVVAIEDSGDGGRRATFEVEEGLERYLVEKGSIAVDGVSLTVVEPKGRLFSVALIPETLERTTLGLARAGQRVNLEADMVGKWIEKMVEARDSG